MQRSSSAKSSGTACPAHPEARVEHIAKQDAVAVAEVEERLRRIRDVLEVDQVHIRLGEVADLGLHPARVPIEHQLRLDVTAPAKDLLAVHQHAPAMPAVELVHFVADLADAEMDRLLVDTRRSVSKVKLQVVEVLLAVVHRPPEARILHHRVGLDGHDFGFVRRQARLAAETARRFPPRCRAARRAPARRWRSPVPPTR